MGDITFEESNRRLEVLANFLLRLDPRRFNYGHWIGWDWEGAPDLSCGTTACALGWATAIPEFNRLGLTNNPDYNSWLGGSWGFFCLNGKLLTATVTAERFFGLTRKEVSYHEVAGHIMRFVEWRKSQQA